MHNKFTSLDLKNIRKEFPGVLALDNVSLKAEAGKVHALMGENGAGKSTLIKILAGAYTKDEGKILFNGLFVIKNILIEEFNHKSHVIKNYKVKFRENNCYLMERND